MILNHYKYKGMSLIALLVTISLFSAIFLVVNKWTSQQRKSAVEIYQRYQAIQIAENQKQRQFLELNCENAISQNGIAFQIQCQGETVIVSYPAGKIQL